MLQFVGNGSAFNFERGNNSAFYKKGKEMLLIDCGGTTTARLISEGIIDSDIEHVHLLLTHTHGDHAGGIGDLALWLYYAHGEFMKNKLTIHTVLGTDVSLLMGVFGCIKDTHYSINKLKNYRLSTLMAGVRATPIMTSHVDELKSYSFILGIDGSKVFYSGDVNALPSNIVKTLHDGGFEYFYVDTATEVNGVHLSLSDLERLISPEVRNKVWCMHLDPKFDEYIAIIRGFNVTQIYKK